MLLTLFHICNLIFFNIQSNTKYTLTNMIPYLSKSSFLFRLLSGLTINSMDIDDWIARLLKSFLKMRVLYMLARESNMSSVSCIRTSNVTRNTPQSFILPAYFFFPLFFKIWSLLKFATYIKSVCSYETSGQHTWLVPDF